MLLSSVPCSLSLPSSLHPSSLNLHSRANFSRREGQDGGRRGKEGVEKGMERKPAGVQRVSAERGGGVHTCLSSAL
eukprot:2219344-Rhodomonas_salina.1